MMYVISITLLFTLLVLMQRRSKKIRCALCVAVCLTWITGLLLFKSGYLVSPILLGILMGQTSLGILHVLEHKVKKKYKAFRLPFLLTMVWIFSSLLEGPEWGSLLLITVLWVVIGVITNLSILHRVTRTLIACCRDW